MKVGARFNSLKEVKKLFPKEFLVTGIGVTAFPRSGLLYILPNYSILSLLETDDLKAIRKKAEVVSMERDLKSDLPEKFNTSSILMDSGVREYLKDRDGLFVYKASTKIDKLASDLGLRLLSTKGSIRKGLENKKQFRVEAEKAGINLIQGETILVDDLDEKRWDKYRKSLGERLVFQLTDYTVGGGLGTFFINKREDFLKFGDFVDRRRGVRKEQNKVINWVNVTRFIEGKQASITGCATRFGTVAGLLQTQVIDQPELAALHGRSGVWLGHDWFFSFSDQEQLAAEEQVKKWGEYIYGLGYRGIFGLDVVVSPAGEQSDSQVWVVECNSRYTGAFPVYTMAQIDRGEMPIDVWHLLEFLKVDYEIEIEADQKEYRIKKKAGHLVLHNLERKYVTPTRTVKAGVYNFKAEWVREGFSLMDIKNEDEVVLVDRVVGEDKVLNPAERLGRLLFKQPLIDKKGRLLPQIQAIVKQIYGKFELMPVEKPAPRPRGKKS